MSSTSARGVTAMFIAVAAFSFMDALLKLLSAHYPALQVGALRFAASIPFVLVWVLTTGRMRDLVPGTPSLHLLRGALGVVMLTGFVFAVSRGSLSEVYALFMCAPLMIVALAAWLLRERADLGRWLAVIIGFAGVLFVLQPQATRVGLAGGIAALVAAACYALAAITARKLTQKDTPASILFSFLSLGALGCGLLAAPNWQGVAAEHWVWIVGIGFLGAIGQYCVTEAFRWAPASTIAPIEYTALLWGLGIDRIFWQTTPGFSTLAGALLVVAAGLYVAWRERRESQTGASSPIPGKSTA